MNTLRIGFFGDHIWSHNLLNKILKDKSIDIRFVCGRNKTNDKKLCLIAKKNNLDFFKTKNINTQTNINNLKKYNCDLYISMSYDQIFQNEVIKLPNKGIINCHAGKLPQYRGRNVLNWVLINGEKEFGITVHFINEKIDDGDIILQRNFKIKKKDNYGSLLKKAFKECPIIMYESIKLIQNNTYKKIPQKDKKNISYFRKRIQGDEIINWEQNSITIFNFIRSISEPGPKAQSNYKKSFIKFNDSKIIKKFNLKKSKKVKAGTIVSISRKKIVIKTFDGYIESSNYSCDLEIEEGYILK